MDLEIDRETWARGGHLGGPALINARGNMCCLGFAGFEIGLEIEDLMEAGEFADLPFSSREHLEGLDFNPFCSIELDPHTNHDTIVNSLFHDEAVELNDFRLVEIDGHPKTATHGESGYMKTEADRELLLTALFEKNGINLTFVGERLDESKINE